MELTDNLMMRVIDIDTCVYMVIVVPTCRLRALLSSVLRASTLL